MLHSLIFTTILLLGNGAPAAARQDPLGAETAAPTEEPEQAPEEPEEPEAPEEPEEPGPPTDAAGWTARVDELLAREDFEPGEADELYPVLCEFLWSEMDRFRLGLRTARTPADLVPPRTVEVDSEGEPAPAETVEELYGSLVALVRARLRLLHAATPELRAQATGLGVTGMHQLGKELETIALHSRYQTLAVPRGVSRLARDLRIAPLQVLQGLFLAVLAAVIFRAWRKWAAAGLPRLRGLVLAAWPRNATAKLIARALWYVNRVRHPLEWLVLLAVLFALARIPEISATEELAKLVVKWVILGWFAVVLVEAVATQGGGAWTFAGRPGEQKSELRLRSLRLVGAWMVFLGLGLDLANYFTGAATVHAWVWRIFELLGVPLGWRLLVLWRPKVEHLLEREAHYSEQVARVLRKRKGSISLLVMVVASVYLAAIWVRRLSLRIVRRSIVGRRLVAEALRQRMAAAAESEEEAAKRHPIAPEVRERLMSGSSVVPEAIRDELDFALDLVERDWPAIVIVAERGGGKSAFLRQLAARLKGDMLVVDTPEGGADDCWRAWLRALDLDQEGTTPEGLAAELKRRGLGVVAFDNLHRIATPIEGGQTELDRFSERMPRATGLSYLITVDYASWQYLTRARESRLGGVATIDLSNWTEEQIAAMIEGRAAEAGIELDYGRLTFPRLLHEQDFDTPEEGLRAAFARVLWREAEGNPGVALRLLADALTVGEHGRVSVGMPANPSPADLERLDMTELLTLRFAIRSDGALLEDVCNGLRVSPGEAAGGLLMGVQQGWLEERDGRYRISWKWFRTVTKVLVRKNLLGTSPHKGVTTPKRTRGSA